MFFRKSLSTIRKLDLPLHLAVHGAHKAIKKALTDHPNLLSVVQVMQLTKSLARIRIFNWRALNSEQFVQHSDWRASYLYKEDAKKSLCELLSFEQQLSPAFIKVPLQENPFASLRDGLDALNDRDIFAQPVNRFH